MRFRNFAALVLGAILAIGFGAQAILAQGTAEGTPLQRAQVMRSRLDSMRRQLNSALASLNAKESGDKADVDDPGNKLRALEQEVNSLSKELEDMRGKIDRGDQKERVEPKEIEKLEASVTDLNTRVQAGLQATAGARVSSGSSSTAAASEPQKNKKKKGKFLGIFGGGGGDDKYAELTDTVAPGRDRQLFEVAAREVRKNNYDTGRFLFNVIITTYPESPYLKLSKLAIADSFYLEGTTAALIQAGESYKDWRTFFPVDALTDRVMLKEAEAEMRQMGLANRDVTRARKAEQRLKALLQQFPNTPIREKVEQRLREVQENLGMHSLQIARFYRDRFYRGVGGLKGAQNRAREIVEKYPHFSYMDEVLFMLGDLYVQEEEPDEAAKYFQMVARDYPNGQYAEKAKDELNKIGAPIPDPDPIKSKMLPPERPGMMAKFMNEVVGSANVSVDKDGVLISKDGKANNDLIDEAIANQGEIRSVTPLPVQQRRAPARSFTQGTTPAPSRGPSSPAPTPTTTTTTAPATTGTRP